MKNNGASVLRILKFPLTGNCQDEISQVLNEAESKVGGEDRAAGQPGVDRSLSPLQMFCAHIVYSLVLHKRSPRTRKKGSHLILSIAPEEPSFPKVIAANVLHNIIHYLLGLSVENSISQDNVIVSQD